MAAGVYKGLTIEIGGKTQGLTQALRSAEREGRTLQKQLKLVDAQKLDGKSAETFARKLSVLSSQAENAKKRLETLKQAEASIGKENMSSDQWAALQFDIAKCEAEIRKYESAIKSVKAEQSKLGELGSDLQNAGAKITDATEGMRNVGDTLSRTVTAGIVGVGVASVAAAVDVDTAMTSVRKTVDGTEEQYEQLRQSALAYSKTQPVSASQLLSIESLGAQLGYSIDELDMFAKVVSGLDIATNMDADTAATELAQFANITNMAHSDTERYASSIVNLGNNLATTESKISDMSMRVAAAGTQVGMSESQILGWSGAMSSMGVEAEAGGTAFSNFVSAIDAAVATGGEDLTAYANVAGMSADAFASAWKASSSDTVQALLEGLSASDNMTLALESMGVTGIRQSDVLKRLAGNTDAVSKALTVANEGWNENTALSREVENRNDSLAAKFETLKNRVTDVAVEVGTPLADALLDVIDAAEPLFKAIENGAESFAAMDKGQQQAIISAVGMVAALGPLLSIAGRVGAGVTTVGKAFSALGALGTACNGKLGSLQKSMSASGGIASKAAGKVGQLKEKLDGASASSGLARAGLGMVAHAVTQLIAALALDAWTKWNDELRRAGEASATLADVQGRVESSTRTLGQTISTSEGASSDMSVAIRTLGEKYDTLRDQISKTNQSFIDSMSAAQQSGGELDFYRKQIGELANQDLPLTATQQGILANAVERYNSITGDSIEIIDAERGALSKSTKEIDENAEAWKRNALAKSYQEMITNAAKDAADAQSQLTDAEKTLASAQKALNEYIEAGGQGGERYEDLAANVAYAQSKVDELKGTVQTSTDKMNDASKAAALMNQTVADFASALEAAGEPADAFEQTANALGIDAESLVTSLDLAGISTEQLASVGSAAFQTLYNNAGGDMTKLKSQLDGIQTFTIDDKHFVMTDDGTIYDEQGQLADLQRVEIAGKHYIVTNDGHIYDEQGQLQGLNSVTIDGKHYIVTNDGTAWTAKEETDAAKSSADNVTGTYTATVSADTSGFFSAIGSVFAKLGQLVSGAWNATIGAHASGGIVNAHASGGFIAPKIRKHAKGYIATSPTVIDIAGEAGAEAIIPLTNKRYVTPFARAVAEQMGTAGQTIDNSITLHVDGAVVNSRPEMEKATYTVLSELKRLGYMQGGA